MNSYPDNKGNRPNYEPENSPLKLSKPIAFFQRLSVGQKIGLGYAIAISIGVLGTVTGTFVGDYYQFQAMQVERQVDEEVELLNELNFSILKARLYQKRLLRVLNDPEKLQQEYVNFIKYASEIRESWEELESFSKEISTVIPEDSRRINELLKTYQGVPQAYVEKVKLLVKEIDINSSINKSKSSQEIQEIKELLVNFNDSSIAIEFDKISDNLSELVENAEDKDEESDAALAQAQTTRRLIVLSTNFASILIATILAYHTTKAISIPINNWTGFAKKTTDDSNFSLQIPVTTNDEIGVLSISINRLIVRVKELLNEQAKAQEKLEFYSDSLEEQVQERTQELENTLQELRYTQTQLIQQEKMSSLGQLVAGIAHEINNPVNFIHANLEYTKNYMQDLLYMVELYQEEYPEPTKIIAEETNNLELDFLQKDLEKILDSMQNGSKRIRDIVISLRTFSRLDESSCKRVNIHDGIDSTLMILQSKLEDKVSNSYKIKVIKNYQQLPLVECYAGELNQVFMNLVVNAIDTLKEKVSIAEDDNPFLNPEITITTTIFDKKSSDYSQNHKDKSDTQWVAIHISDNGLGMTEKVRTEMFNPFFTTKEVGRGTGLGLAISYQIIVDRHHGELKCFSVLGEGTEFVIEIPVE